MAGKRRILSPFVRKTANIILAKSSPKKNTNADIKTIGQQRFQNQGKNSISSIIGSYKSAVTKHAHRLRYKFAWQSRYHDHIIRNNDEYQRIKDYIINNPQNWNNDKFK